jgi:U6 snRNA-associated Sm-like protein LSm8
LAAVARGRSSRASEPGVVQGDGDGGDMSAPTLTNMLDARVSVITNDGRHIVVILEDCAERVYSSESGVEEAPLGLYMIRGDNVCVNARRRRRGGEGFEWTEDARALERERREGLTTRNCVARRTVRSWDRWMKS